MVENDFARELKLKFYSADRKPVDDNMDRCIQGVPEKSTFRRS